MAQNNDFVEILKISNQTISCNNLAVVGIFGSNFVANLPIAIHVVIGGDKFQRSLILGRLAEHCFQDSQSLNQHLDTSLPYSAFFQDACRMDGESKQMVAFKYPIYSTAIDKQKRKVANFFLTLWSSGTGNEESIVLSGLASALASSITYYVDSKIKVQNMEWLKMVASVSFRVEGIEQFQSLCYLSKCWDRSCKYQLGFQKTSDFLDSLFRELGDPQLSACLTDVSKKTFSFLVQNNVEINSSYSQRTLNQFCRCLLDVNPIKCRARQEIIGNEVVEILAGLDSYEEYVNFADTSPFRCIQTTMTADDPGIVPPIDVHMVSESEEDEPQLPWLNYSEKQVGTNNTAMPNIDVSSHAFSSLESDLVIVGHFPNPIETLYVSKNPLPVVCGKTLPGISNQLTNHPETPAGQFNKPVSLSYASAGFKTDNPNSIFALKPLATSSEQTPNRREDQNIGERNSVQDMAVESSSVIAPFSLTRVDSSVEALRVSKEIVPVVCDKNASTDIGDTAPKSSLFSDNRFTTTQPLSTPDETLDRIFSMTTLNSNSNNTPSPTIPADLSHDPEQLQDDGKNFDNQTQIYKENLLKAVISEFEKAPLSSSSTVSSLLQRSFALVKADAKTSIVDNHVKNNLRKVVRIISNLQQQFEEQMAFAVFYETDEELVKKSNEITEQYKHQTLEDPFQMALESKMRHVVESYKDLNEKIRINERITLDFCRGYILDNLRNLIKNRGIVSHQQLNEYVQNSIKDFGKAYGHPRHGAFLKSADELKREVDEFWKRNCQVKPVTVIPGDDNAKSRNIPTTKMDGQKLSSNDQKNSVEDSSTCASFLDDKPFRFSLEHTTVAKPPQSNTKIEKQPPINLINHVTGGGQPRMHSSSSNLKDVQSHRIGWQSNSRNSSSHNTSNHLSQELVIPQVAVYFGWRKVTAFYQNGAEEKTLFDQLPAQIWFSDQSDEIIFGNQFHSGQIPYKIFEIVEYFLAPKNSKKKFPDGWTRDRIISVFAITFHKLHNMICDRLKCSQMVMGIVFPSFGCKHLAQVIIDAGNLSQLNLVIANHSVCIMANDRNTLSVSGSTLALNEYSHLHYSSLELYRINENGMQLLQVDHDWDSSTYYGLRNTSSHSNVLTRFDYKKIDGRITAILNCSQEEISSKITKDLKGKIKNCQVLFGRGFPEIVRGMFVLVRESCKATYAQDKLIRKLLSDCLLSEISKKMKIDCGHVEFKPTNINECNLSLKIREIAQKDKQLLIECKKSGTEILNQILFMECPEHKKRRILEAIIAIENAVSKKEVDQIVFTSTN